MKKIKLHGQAAKRCPHPRLVFISANSIRICYTYDGIWFSDLSINKIFLVSF